MRHGWQLAVRRARCWAQGTIARLLNSSCAPNCEAQKWQAANSDEVRIGIFALRDIPPGEELTYDYKFQHHGHTKAAMDYRRAHTLHEPD